MEDSLNRSDRNVAQKENTKLRLRSSRIINDTPSLHKNLLNPRHNATAKGTPIPDAPGDTRVSSRPRYESKLHFNLIALCRFTMPTGRRSVMGARRREQRTCRNKTSLRASSLSLTASLRTLSPLALGHLNHAGQDVHTGRYNRETERGREREREGASSLSLSSSYVYILRPPRVSSPSYPTRIIPRLVCIYIYIYVNYAAVRGGGKFYRKYATAAKESANIQTSL